MPCHRPPGLPSSDTSIDVRRPYVLCILDASLLRSCAREEDGRLVWVFRSGEDPFSSVVGFAGRGCTCDVFDGILVLSVAMS